eukprot:m.41352 g.41352  ORF g.41352 m.41352 type:complete len:325 (+) comp33140_c0_seq2:186-1160(+)
MSPCGSYSVLLLCLLFASPVLFSTVNSTQQSNKEIQVEGAPEDPQQSVPTGCIKEGVVSIPFGSKPVKLKCCMSPTAAYDYHYYYETTTQLQWRRNSPNPRKRTVYACLFYRLSKPFCVSFETLAVAYLEIKSVTSLAQVSSIEGSFNCYEKETGNPEFGEKRVTVTVKVTGIPFEPPVKSNSPGAKVQHYSLKRQRNETTFPCSFKLKKVFRQYSGDAQAVWTQNGLDVPDSVTTGIRQRKDGTQSTTLYIPRDYQSGASKFECTVRAPAFNKEKLLRKIFFTTNGTRGRALKGTKKSVFNTDLAHGNDPKNELQKHQTDAGK